MDTSRYFITEDLNTESDADLNYESCGWPPFRKVGYFAPFTDDPRFSVKTVDLSQSGQLVVGGQSGQLLLCSLTNKRVRPGQTQGGQTSLSSLKEFDIAVTDIDLMAEDEDFVWKGQEPMDVRSCQFRHPAGFRPHHILQLDPPSSITSLATSSDWGLLAAGQVQFCFHFSFLIKYFRFSVWIYHF